MRALALAFAFACAIASRLAAATPVPGTGVVLDPPPGFTAAEQFPGFIQKETSASIMVSEIPGPYAEVAKGFTPSGFASKGMKLLKRESVPVAGSNGLLLRVSQQAHGTTFAKWMLAFGDARKTTLIVATYPADAEADLGVALRESVLSARHSGHTPSLTEGLTFEITEKPPLRIAQRIGNAVILTVGERTPDAPLLVIGSSVTEDLRIPNFSAHAKKRLHEIAHLADVELRTETAAKIDGLPGVTLTATGRDKKTGATQFVRQTTLYHDDGYFIAQGFTPPDQREAFEPVFEAIVASFRRKL